MEDDMAAGQGGDAVIDMGQGGVMATVTHVSGASCKGGVMATVTHVSGAPCMGVQG